MHVWQEAIQQPILPSRDCRSMPLVVKVNPSMLDITEQAVNTSISIQCFQRWDEAMNISLAHRDLDDPRADWSGLPGRHQVFNYTFKGRVLLIHIAKAGGSTVNRILRSVHAQDSRLGSRRVLYDRVHMHPVPHIAIASHARIVVCVRDPVDRFISAYNWGFRQDQPWAKRLHSCWDVNEFVVEFAYRRINPLLQRGRLRCATLQPIIDAWTRQSGPNYTDYGHIRMDGCFYLGGCIDYMTALSKEMFVVRTEMMTADSHSLLKWLDVTSVPHISHINDNSAANHTRQLQPFAQEALEVALKDEYQLANRLLQMSVNAKLSAYCVNYAELDGLALRCNGTL